MKPPEIQPPGDDTPGAAWDWEDPNPPFDYTRVQGLADDLLVHALLLGRFQDTPEIVSQRAARVCSAFERSLGTTRWYWRAGLSTAAAAVILLSLALFSFSTQNVQAQLGQVLDAFDAGDQTYQIEINEDTEAPLPDSRRGWTRPLHRPAFKPARGRMSAQRLEGALLYVRNRQQVLTYTLLTGLKIARGFDGRQSWMTHPSRKFLTGSDPNLLRAEISEEAVSLLFLDLRDMLHQIRKNYALSRPSLSPASDGKTAVLYLVADRVTPRARLPRRIELWVDAQTGQIHDIVCTGLRLHRSALRYTLRITLVSADALSFDWFTPEAHLSREQNR